MTKYSYFPRELRSLIFFLIFVFALTACEEKKPPKVDVIRPVKTTVVEAPTLNRTRVFPGKVEAAERVDLSFQVSGALTKLPVQRGLDVEKGDVLAQLDDRDYRSNLKAAQAEYKRAQADFKRAADIFKKKLISVAQVDQIRADRDVASANREKAQKALNDTTLLAPFSGTVATINVDNFQDVNAKEPVLSLQDNSALDIVIQVPENLIVRAGNRRDSIDLYASFEAFPDKSLPLKIKEFSTKADPDTQTFEFVLTMPAPKNLNVLPGMSVSVEATPRAGSEEIPGEALLIKIPASSVFADPSGTQRQFVWVYTDSSQTVDSREVSIGRLGGAQVEIISGLEAGEIVVTAGVHYLQAGQKVRLFEGKVGAN